MHTTTLDSLRALYAPAGGRSVMKELPAMDASPRGGAPGFVKALDTHTLLIAGAPGDNWLDTLENIVRGGAQGGHTHKRG